MKQFDLKKNSIENFERVEEPVVSNDMAEQDILRCWECHLICEKVIKI